MVSRVKTSTRTTGKTGGRTSYAVPKHHAQRLPDPRTRHILSRFSSGVNASRLAAVTSAGGIDAWFAKQLTPGSIPDKDADALWGWFPDLALSPQQKYAAFQAGTLSPWQLAEDFASWTMLRRFISRRQVEEMMVDFWSNLLHVASPFDSSYIWRVDYQETIRQNAFGRFDTLLAAAITHPAMGMFLNNVESTSTAVNENLGREVLECYTVGVDAGYTQGQVIDSARILTGFHVDSNNTWAASYVPANHWVGRVKVLGFTSANASSDGRPVLSKYLTYLARHPATAQRLCTRLAVRFVSDTPSQALVDMLATTYLAADTAIKPVLLALVASDEFQSAILQKVRTPVEDAIATWVALGVQVAPPQSEQDAANQLIFVSQAVGQLVFDWPTPDAFPDVAAAWTGSGRMLGSMCIHWYAANANWPNHGITYQTPMQWMPQLPTTFDNVVDYIVRRALCLECTPTMLQSACVATDCLPTDVIDSQHPVTSYRFSSLLVSILDTPEHLSR